MCNNWLLLELFSLRKVLKYFCTLLTLFLVCQELFTFVVIKPTSTSKEEKEIDITDLPEVVICLDPGFDSRVLKKYGYRGWLSNYYRGSINDEFVGWNGRKKETRSSREILDEALVVSNTQFIKWAAYYNLDHNVEAKVGLRTLTYPLGRCLSISPPPIYRNISNTMLNTLYLDFEESVLDKYKDYKNFKIMIYFMDNTNSLKIYPNEDDIVGSPLKVSLAELSNFDSTYRTKISRSEHVAGDPLFKCTEYTLNDPYNDCIQNELLESFHQILGCQPSLLQNDPSRMCDLRFNLSVDETCSGKYFTTMQHLSARHLAQQTSTPPVCCTLFHDLGPQ